MHWFGASIFLVGDSLMCQSNVMEATRAPLGQHDPCHDALVITAATCGLSNKTVVELEVTIPGDCSPSMKFRQTTPPFTKIT
jgi:hypothetical protein